MSIIHYSPIWQTIISHLDYSTCKKLIVTSKIANKYNFLKDSLEYFKNKYIKLFQLKVKKYVKDLKFFLNPDNPNLDGYFFTRKNIIRYYFLEYPDKYFLKYPETSLIYFKNYNRSTPEQEEYIKNLPPIENRTRKMIKDYMTKFLSSQDIYNLGW